MDDGVENWRALKRELLSEVRSVVTSALDIQNKLASCNSETFSTHLNDDIPLANLEKADLDAMRSNFIIARAVSSMGAVGASLNWIHENNELANLTRARNALTAKLLRSTISSNTSRYTEERPGMFGNLGRSKEASQA